MKKIIAIFFLLLLFSCNKSQKYILYKYNDIYITRIDTEYSETYLYYGKISGNNSVEPDIIIKYPGFDNLMDGYMIFSENSVIIIPLVGDFKNQTNKKELSIKVVNNNVKHNHWVDGISGKYNNVCRISDIIKREQDINNVNKTKVEILYSH